MFREIWTGSFPALVAGPVRDRDLFYRSYYQTYLERDVRDLARVGDRESFHRFVRACAARTGQMLNLSDIARDVGVSVPTAKSWLSVLIASFQVLLLEPWQTNLSKRMVKTPKLYFLDTGLCSWLTEWSSPATLAAGAMAGAIFETWMIGEIVKSWWHRSATPHLYYYRDKDGVEIDLLMSIDGMLHPVEIELSKTPRREWAARLGTLGRRAQNVGTGAVLCLSTEQLPLDRGVWAVPAGWV